MSGAPRDYAVFPSPQYPIHSSALEHGFPGDAEPMNCRRAVYAVFVHERLNRYVKKRLGTNEPSVRLVILISFHAPMLCLAPKRVFALQQGARAITPFYKEHSKGKHSRCDSSLKVSSTSWCLSCGVLDSFSFPSGQLSSAIDAQVLSSHPANGLLPRGAGRFTPSARLLASSGTSAPNLLPASPAVECSGRLSNATLQFRTPGRIQQ